MLFIIGDGVWKMVTLSRRAGGLKPPGCRSVGAQRPALQRDAGEAAAIGEVSGYTHRDFPGAAVAGRTPVIAVGRRESSAGVAMPRLPGSRLSTRESAMRSA